MMLALAGTVRSAPEAFSCTGHEPERVNLTLQLQRISSCRSSGTGSPA